VSNDGKIDARWFYGAIALLIAIVFYIWGAGGFREIGQDKPETPIEVIEQSPVP